MTKVRTRIAPSPTGSPHIGTAYAALFNYCFAKQHNGDFILRIEDTDRSRFVEGSEKEIIESLEWLELVSDENPLKAGKFGPYRQSERLEIYKDHTSKLIEKGKAYYCNCAEERLEKVRTQQQAKKEVPHYDRKCRFDPPKNTQGCVVRLAVPENGVTIITDKIRGDIEFQNSGIDDQVLLKSDGFPTYHLASVVDDHLMEISHVIRAEEWLSSTPKHVLLYQAFGWKAPEFVHLALLRNRDRSKISKRKNPVSLTFYKDQGYLPEALVNFLGLMGWSMPHDQEIFALNEMIKEFDLSRLDVSGPIFDIQKLDWLNGEYIRKLTDEKLTEKIVYGNFTKYPKADVKRVLSLVKERLKKLSEFDSLTHYFFEERLEPNISLINQVSNHSPLATISVLKDFHKTAEKIQSNKWTKEILEKTFKDKPQEHDWSKTNYFQTIRTTVSGSNQTPPLFDILQEIGKDKILNRTVDTISALEKLSE